MPNDASGTPPNPNPPQKNANEASAADLLSLWGGGSAKPAAPPSAVPKPAAPEPVATPMPTPTPAPTPAPVPAPAQTPPPTPRPVSTAAPEAPKPTPPLPPAAPKPEPSPAALPKPVPQKAEASAADLLSLWGTQPAKQAAPSVSMPAPAPVPAPTLTPPTAPATPKPMPSVPPRPVTAAPVQPPPSAVPSRPVAPAPQPASTYTPPLRPTPTPAPVLPPKPAETSAPPPPKPTQPEKPKLTTEPLETKKKPPPEAIEGELVGESKAVPEADDLLEEHTGGFGSQLDEFLEELHLSRRHLLYGAGCLILLVVFIFGGMAAFRYWKNLPSDEPASESPESPETEEAPEVSPGVTDEETGVAATKKLGDLTHDDVGDTGLSATLSAGRQDTGFTPLAEYLLDFRRLENAYDTNINQLLDAATDRRARFQSYLILMKSLLKKAYENVLTMDRELVAIENTYNPIRDRQAETDKNFFQEVRALNGKTAEDLLEEFIKASREVVTLRARFKAVKEVRAYFVQAIPKLEARIKDIELNEEPLVSGIKVYDVRGSDVELIVPVDSNTETLREEPLREGKVKVTSPPSTGVPFLPVHPSQVDTGADYITSPGGGF